MQFNKQLITQPNTVVHCTTEEQARQLLDWAIKEGFKWSSDDTHWEDYKRETYYRVSANSNSVTYARLDHHNYDDDTILTFKQATTSVLEDFIGEMVEVKDSNVGDWKRRKLIAILPDNQISRYICEMIDVSERHVSWEQCQPITKPKLLELTMSDLAEKYGCEVKIVKDK